MRSATPSAGAPRGVDLDSVPAEVRRLLAGRTMTRPELGRLLAERWPGVDPGALAWTAQYLVPLVHPAPSGTWDHRGRVSVALADDHLGRSPETPDLRRLVRAHLAAFGPATAADIRAWSGVAGLREVVDSMRTELRRFLGPGGQELVDLPDAPRPEADTPAPVRLLGGFDELLLAFADRTRIMTDEVRRQVCVGDLIEATVLVDGTVAGTWHLDRERHAITIRPFIRLRQADADAAIAEGHRLLAFVHPTGTANDIRFEVHA